MNHVKELNEKLKDYKKKIKKAYLDDFKARFNLSKVEYDYCFVRIDEKQAINSTRLLAEKDIEIFNQFQTIAIKESIDAINDYIKGKKVIICGASEHTKKWMTYMDRGVQIVAFADKYVDEFCGNKVINYDEIEEYKFDYLLVSSSHHETDITDVLRALGYGNRIISIYRVLEDNYFRDDNRTILDI